MERVIALDVGGTLVKYGVVSMETVPGARVAGNGWMTGWGSAWVV